MNLIKNILDNYYSMHSTNKYLYGTSLARVGLGLIILYNYLILYFQRDILLTNNSIVGKTVNDFSIYNYITNDVIFEFIYHIGIFVVILYILGIYTFVIGIFNYLFVFSYINHTYLISDGGDNLLLLLLFYLLFTNNSVHYSLKPTRYSTNKQLIILHNFAVYTCIIQICIVYFISAMYQVNGEKWFNGTAIYYISQVNVFFNYNIDSFLTNNVYTITLLTYASILIKIAFPFLIFNKKTKFIIITCIILFHLGIAVFMGLITFALTMIVAELLLFTDNEYLDMKNRFKLRYFKRGVNIG